jgi:hypothetical protein
MSISTNLQAAIYAGLVGSKPNFVCSYFVLTYITTSSTYCM